jgi:hypothetical protein
MAPTFGRRQACTTPRSSPGEPEAQLRRGEPPKSRTLCCLPVAMTKSSAWGCCSISHCAST